MSLGVHKPDEEGTKSDRIKAVGGAIVEVGVLGAHAAQVACVTLLALRLHV